MGESPINLPTVSKGRVAMGLTPRVVRTPASYVPLPLGHGVQAKRREDHQVCRRSERGRHSMLVTWLCVVTPGIALILAIIFHAGQEVTGTLTGMLALAISRVRVPSLSNQDPASYCSRHCGRDGCESLPTPGNVG